MKGSEIPNITFSVGIMGFKREDVKNFLKEISEYVLKLENKLYNAEVERDKLKDKLNKNEINQANFKDIIASAQEFKSRIETESQKKANDLVQRAKNEAKEILVKAQKQHEEIAKAIRGEKSKLGIMKREVEGVRKTIIGKLDDFVNMLEFKEKNTDLSRENITFKTNPSEFFTQNFGEEKTIKIVNENEKKETENNIGDESLINVAENKVSGEEQQIYSSKNQEVDDEYIKARFNEIEFR